MLFIENEKQELKSSLGEWREIIIALCAFANRKGGKVIVGIDDNGNPTSMTIGKGKIEDFVNKVKNNTDPVLYPSINVKTFGPGEIIEIEIPGSDYKPVFAFERAFIRVGKNNLKLSNHEIRELINRYKTADFDTAFFDKPPDEIELDSQLILQLNKDFFKLRTTNYKEILEHLRVFKGNRVTNAGYLCFVKQNTFMSNAVVKAARFKGQTMAQFIDMKDFDSNMIDGIDRVLDFIKRHINMQVVIDGGARRKEIWEYPLRALREAVINAIVHRDYSDPGNIQIRIFDDTLEVWSPGLLPKEITIDNLLSEIRSIPRNREIARIFHAVELIENWGSGFHRMVDACARNGNLNPEFSEKAGAFVITFYKAKVEKKRETSFVEGINEDGGINGGLNGGINEDGGLNGGLNILIEYIKKNPGKRINEISSALDIPGRTLEKWIKKLKDKKEIVFKGSKKTGGYFER